jgi:sugar lactone lactonase YvrE
LVGDGCPGTKATFWRPYQPFVDAAGNVYVTDQDNFLIRKLSVGTQFPATASGASITQSVDIHFGAGDGPATSSPYTLPSGFNEFSIGTPACTTNSDTTQDCVLPVKFTPATAGVRSAPLTVTSAGKLVSNFSLTGTGLAPVLAIDPGTQATIAPTGANAALTGVSGIALDDAGDVFATVPAANTLYEVNFSGTETNLGSGFSSATANAVALDAAGNVYAALSNGSIEKLPGGNAASATPLASGFTAPSGIAVDSFGNVYVTDVDAKTVSEILAGTGVQLVLPMPSLGGPTGVAVDTFGNVFVADSVNNDVVELPFNGSEAVKLGAGLDAPLGLAVDPAGSLYIADSKNSRIVFIPNEGAPNTSTLNTADQIAIIAKLGTPTGIAVAGSGTVYVADSYANSIYTFTRNAASINLGNALTAIGAESSATNTAVADIVSMGTKPAAFGSAFATASGSNTADFSLSPSSIPVSSDFPNAGFGLTLTAGFTPTALGSRSAEYTFGATNVTQPTLSLSGAGIQPHDITTTTVVSTPPSGQTNWTYGQTVTVNITVSVNSGLPAPTGNVSVYVDGGSTAASTPQLTAGNASSIASIAFPGLSAGPHTFTASYGGDTESSASSSTLLTLNVATAPLTVTVNNLSNPFDAPLPTLTGVLTGVQNGDQIGVNYTTTATAASLVGQYPINATVTGSAVGSYSVTVNPGTLSVTQDSTVTTVGVSATSVNPATQVTLTASVGNQNNYAIVSIPTGSVTFFNTVGATQTQIGTATLNSSGVATYQATFAVAGQTANNMVTAVYSGDPNFLTSTSAGIAVVSGAPTFSLTSSPNSSVTVAPGQSGLMSFNLVPAFGYNGTIGFSCTGATATVSCSFSPATVTADGSNTGSLIAVTINTQQPGSPLASSKRPNGNIAGGKLPMSLAVIPGLALLFGFSGLRRKFLRGYRSLLFVALCLAGLGFTGCGAAKLTTGTPAGNQTITVVATGTGGSFASVTQQFTVTLTVQ